jgi:hypothetical protein
MAAMAAVTVTAAMAAVTVTAAMAAVTVTAETKRAIKKEKIIQTINIPSI